MTYLTAVPIALSLLVSPALRAQQSPSPTQPIQKQTATAPCVAGTASGPLTSIKIKPTSRWQKLLNEQMKKIEDKSGITIDPIDLNKVVKDAQTPSPCPLIAKPSTTPPTQIPPTAPTNGAVVTPKPSAALHCNPFGFPLSSAQTAILTTAGAPQTYDDVLYDGTSNMPCSAVQFNLLTGKWSAPDSHPAPVAPSPSDKP